jgi:hypothetical protein
MTNKIRCYTHLHTILNFPFAVSVASAARKDAILESNRRRSRITLIALLVLFLTVQSFSADPAVSSQPDLTTITRIRQEGFRNSKVMDIMSELTDRIGGRLTGSANLKRANEWTRDQLTAYGLANAHLESWSFGRGWAMDSVSIRMTAPDVAPLYALPKAWTPATAVKGEVVRLNAATVEDLAKEKGKYAGKIVLIGEVRDLQPQAEAALRRYDEAKLTTARKSLSVTSSVARYRSFSKKKRSLAR